MPLWIVVRRIYYRCSFSFDFLSKWVSPNLFLHCFERINSTPGSDKGPYKHMYAFGARRNATCVVKVVEQRNGIDWPLSPNSSREIRTVSILAGSSMECNRFSSEIQISRDSFRPGHSSSPSRDIGSSSFPPIYGPVSHLRARNMSQ